MIILCCAAAVQVQVAAEEDGRRQLDAITLINAFRAGIAANYTYTIEEALQLLNSSFI